MPEVVVPLTIRDLTAEDLPSCPWLAPAPYLASVAQGLECARRAMRTTSRSARRPACQWRSAASSTPRPPPPDGCGIWRCNAALQYLCGIGGTLLIQAAEQRIRARGLHRAELKVEECNPRARALYERLGYVACDRAPASWDVQSADGSFSRYETVCTLMRKELS